MNAISDFSGEYRFLSNFYQFVTRQGISTNVEILFQAEKATNDEDRNLILSASSPGVAKKLGKRIALRPDWDEVKDEIMQNLIISKFTSDRVLANKLLQTGTMELIESNYWNDTYWGICKCPEHMGEGENKLGKILMSVRDELRDGTLTVY